MSEKAMRSRAAAMAAPLDPRWKPKPGELVYLPCRAMGSLVAMGTVKSVTPLGRMKLLRIELVHGRRKYVQPFTADEVRPVNAPARRKKARAS